MKTTKTKTAMSFAIFSLFFLLFSFASCGGDSGGGETTHTHTFEAGNICTTEQECTDCGESVGPLGHLALSGTPATCTTPGNTGTGDCTRCGETVTGDC